MLRIRCLGYSVLLEMGLANVKCLTRTFAYRHIHRITMHLSAAVFWAQTAVRNFILTEAIQQHISDEKGLGTWRVRLGFGSDLRSLKEFVLYAFLVKAFNRNAGRMSPPRTVLFAVGFCFRKSLWTYVP